LLFHFSDSLNIARSSLQGRSELIKTPKPRFEHALTLAVRRLTFTETLLSFR
jgi:hypothetical protein